MRTHILRWAFRSGATGGFVALVCFGLLQIDSSRWGLYTDYLIFRAICLVWPSSVWLLATKGIEHTIDGWVIVAMSISANGLPYAVMGGVLSVFRGVHGADELGRLVTPAVVVRSGECE